MNVMSTLLCAQQAVARMSTKRGGRGGAIVNVSSIAAVAWLGPAPKRPFNSNRFHYNFRWFWDYAGGLMTDWGVYLLNLAISDLLFVLARVIARQDGGSEVIWRPVARRPE